MILDFTCNGLTRIIQRVENAVVAVRQDYAVDTVRMIFRPEEFNNISLATVSVKFLYVDTDGEIKAYQTGTTPDGGVYVADWELTDDVVDDAGYINFAVKLAVVNGDTVEKQWFSIPDTFRVYDSVDDTNNPPGETAAEQATNAEKIAQLQSQLGTATSDISSLTATATLLQAQLNTLSDNITGLRLYQNATALNDIPANTYGIVTLSAADSPTGSIGSFFYFFTGNAITNPGKRILKLTSTDTSNAGEWSRIQINGEWVTGWLPSATEQLLDETISKYNFATGSISALNSKLTAIDSAQSQFVSIDSEEITRLLTKTTTSNNYGMAWFSRLADDEYQYFLILHGENNAYGGRYNPEYSRTYDVVQLATKADIDYLNNYMTGYRNITTALTTLDGIPINTYGIVTLHASISPTGANRAFIYQYYGNTANSPGRRVLKITDTGTSSKRAWFRVHDSTSWSSDWIEEVNKDMLDALLSRTELQIRTADFTQTFEMAGAWGVYAIITIPRANAGNQIFIVTRYDSSYAFVNELYCTPNLADNFKITVTLDDSKNVVIGRAGAYTTYINAIMLKLR